MEFNLFNKFMYNRMLENFGQKQTFGLVMETIDRDRMSNMVLWNYGEKMIILKHLVLIGFLSVFNI